MYRHYAPEPRMRCNVGIRRRLAPLMDNDRSKIELLNSLLMSMPGTPSIYYGDELGMGDDISLDDRDGVRTPMQWSGDLNGGFSRADPERLYLPAMRHAPHGYESTNVAAQSRSPSSVLNWIRELINIRRSHPAFGRGSIQFLYPKNSKILAYLRRHEGQTLLCVANLAPASQRVELDLSEFAGQVPNELLNKTPFPEVTERPYPLTISGHGFYWISLGPPTRSVPLDVERGLR